MLPALVLFDTNVLGVAGAAVVTAWAAVILARGSIQAWTVSVECCAPAAGTATAVFLNTVASEFQGRNVRWLKPSTA